MSLASKLLPALALAMALSPVAAQARHGEEPGPAEYYLAPLPHQDVQKCTHIDKVTAGSAAVDRASSADKNMSTGA